MITLNKKHFNLEKIAKASDAKKLMVKRDYRIYGIADDSDRACYAIHIAVPNHLHNLGYNSDLHSFFASNSMHIHIVNIDDDEENNIRIGFRKDIRDHVKICAAALRTIIFYYENRLKSPLSYSIPGIPKFGSIQK